MLPETAKERLERAYRILDHLEREIAKVDEEIQGKVPFHVRRRWKRCGKRGCACTRGLLHGPYLYGYLPSEEVNRKRREKGGRGSTRKEVYLGKEFQPPEGWAKPWEVRALIVRRNSLKRRREKILNILMQIEREVYRLG